ncbi:FAD:protein FMN transferase ApbE [Citrobacter sp. JGM124]|uniref:FAD:protein FMN transferase ApbE n=1 Tax=Citrobacter sp. JGM124 TaxID=2799789 RepID=UPI001BA67D49|nr:FAD:protein FMN transferase ApbE [Citrobacter sp. JGM124]MBS0846857.1 FAD:protein FMN transferase ApbE [Citrobacter sp. JGM124]
MNLRMFCQIWLVILVVLLAGCDKPDPSASQASVLEGKTMGTFWRVSLAGVDRSQVQGLREKIQAQLDADDMLMSTWKKDSALSRFNQFKGTTPYPVSEGMSDIITMALRIGAKTHNTMDITVGPLVDLWGFGPHKAPERTPDEEQINATKALTGLEHLRVINASGQQWLQKSLPELSVDLSTIGEGYAADHLAKLLEQNGISRYLVSVGGTVVTRGMNPQGKAWRVAIQKPTDREMAIQALVDINGHAISTSGSYLNYYELDGKRISHIIDPRTGRPITHNLVSVSVIGTTAMEADGWDTGLMVLGTEKAKQVAEKEGLAVYLITKEGNGFSTWMSPQFKTFLLEEYQ